MASRASHREVVARRVGAVRERFSPARDVLEAWARSRLADPDAGGAGPPAHALPDARPPDDRAGLRAVATLVALAARLHRLAGSTPATASPIADELAADRAELARQGLSLLRTLPGALRRGGSTSTTAAALAGLDTAERLLRRLVLVAAAPVQDHLGGLCPDAPFPSFRVTAGNRGQVRRGPTGPTPGPPAEPWSTPLGGLVWPSAVVDAAGDLYTGHAESEFVALHADGRIKWRHHDDAMMYVDSTGALGRDGWLYAASTDVDARGHQNQGRLWKLDRATGEPAWTFWGTGFEDPETDPKAHRSSFFEGNVALGRDAGRVVVYAGSDDNLLYKLDDDGALLWTYDTDASPGGVIWTKPLLTPDGATVVIGDLAGQVHAVRTADGTRRWIRRLGGAVVSSPALGLGGELVVGSFDGRVTCLDHRDGAVLWSYQTLGLVYSSPAVDAAADGEVVIGSTDGGLYRLDRFGRRRWTYWTAGPVKSSPVLDADGNAYIGCEAGTLYCIDRSGRRRWSYVTDPGATANPVNSSPSLGADGTCYVGTSTGAVVAVPAGWCESHGDHPAVSLDPGHDGARPDVPPDGATLVPVDRLGAPQLGDPGPLALSDHLHLALIAVDATGDVVDARLVGDVDVEIDPPLEVEARVESMGRFLYLLPRALLQPATTYRIHVRAGYQVSGRRRRVERTVERRTTDDDGGTGFPLVAGGDGVGAVVLHDARVASPKELDAVGQAMIDSQRFAVAPLDVDEGTGHVLAAVVWVQDTPDGYVFRPATTNKAVFSGAFRGGWFTLEGSLRLVAQGINIAFDRVGFRGRLFADRTGDGVVAALVTAVGGAGEFAELIRVMSLADSDDEVVGFVAFEVSPFDSPALSRPAGVTAEATWTGGEMTVSVHGPAAVVGGDHWLHVTFWDPGTGRAVPGQVRRGGDGTARVAVPPGVDGPSWRAVVGWDLVVLVSVARTGTAPSRG